MQEYFVYCKKKFLNQGANYPSDAAPVLCGVALWKPPGENILSGKRGAALEHFADKRDK